MRYIPLLLPVLITSEPSVNTHGRRKGGQHGNELKDLQFCPRDLPSLGLYKGVQTHFTVQCRLLHLQQLELRAFAMPLMHFIFVVWEMGEYYNVSFLGWQNMAALMLTLLSDGKSPFVTKRCFRNTSYWTVLKAIVHQSLDTLCLASLYICCPFPTLLLVSF